MEIKIIFTDKHLIIYVNGKLKLLRNIAGIIKALYHESLVEVINESQK